MKFKITNKTVWNKIDKEKVTIYYIMHSEHPRFEGIIHYEDKLTFWIKNIDESTIEEMDRVIKEAHEFLSKSSEVQDISINYYLVKGRIEF